MSFEPNDSPNQFKRQRKSIRLKSFAYDSPGAYFVTIETFGQQRIFGKIVTDTVDLTPLGSIVQECWKRIPSHVPFIQLDEYVVMPNHLHGILWINESSAPKMESVTSSTLSTGVQLNARTGEFEDHRQRYSSISPKRGTGEFEEHRQKFSSISPKRGTVGVVIRTFKGAVTTESRRIGLESRVWKRNYYDRVIRNENELNRIREYIINNPAQWAVDKKIIPIEQYLFP